MAEDIINNSKKDINLKGILVGNGLTDLDVDIEGALVDFAFGHGLYSLQTHESFIANCKTLPLTDACKAARKEIKNSLQGLNIYDVYRQCPPQKKEMLKFLYSNSEIENKNKIPQQKIMINTLKRISKQQKLEKLMKENSSFFDILEESYLNLEKLNLKKNDITDDEDTGLWPDGCLDDPFPTEFFNKAETKTKLNVRTSITYVQCNENINTNYTFGDSLQVYNRTLLNSGIRIWFYAGDTDGAVPFTGTIKWLPKLKMDITEPYRKWVVNGQTAGYVQSYDSIVYITIKGTGHMAPQWKREESFLMFNSFLKGERLPIN